MKRIIPSLQAGDTAGFRVIDLSLNGPLNANTAYTVPPSTYYISNNPIDIRYYAEVLLTVEADQAIDVIILNTPTGDLALLNELEGYSIPNASFTTTRRNTIAMVPPSSNLGFIKIRYITGSSPPSNISAYLLLRRIEAVL